LSYPFNNNRLSGITQGATTLRTVTHDGAGNITTDVRGSRTYSYNYNKRGRLDQLTIGSTVTASYIYDGLERMAIRTTQDMTTSVAQASTSSSSRVSITIGTVTTIRRWDGMCRPIRSATYGQSN